jgi:hypothetical protein
VAPAGTRWHLVALDAKPREVTIETKVVALATKHRQTASANGVEIVERLSREEGKQLVDRQARKYLKMSGEDFARQYREGRIEDPDRLAVSRVAILLPLVES